MDYPCRCECFAIGFSCGINIFICAEMLYRAIVEDLLPHSMVHLLS
jgi:hypothetical protein